MSGVKIALEFASKVDVSSDFAPTVLYTLFAV